MINYCLKIGHHSLFVLPSSLLAGQPFIHRERDSRRNGLACCGGEFSHLSLYLGEI